ncbi:hypothetical protein [Caulobacter vibrioides]|nr:hypothetical protein [Caulobacter vibrioides]
MRTGAYAIGAPILAEAEKRREAQSAAQPAAPKAAQALAMQTALTKLKRR